MGARLELYLRFILGFLLLLGEVNCDSRRPLLRVPSGGQVTGCYVVVLREKATEEEMSQTMNTVSKLADGAIIYNSVHRVVKAFTVKLSSYSLEIVGCIIKLVHLLKY